MCSTISSTLHVPQFVEWVTSNRHFLVNVRYEALSKYVAHFDWVWLVIFQLTICRFWGRLGGKRSTLCEIFHEEVLWSTVSHRTKEWWCRMVSQYDLDRQHDPLLHFPLFIRAAMFLNSCTNGWLLSPHQRFMQVLYYFLVKFLKISLISVLWKTLWEIIGKLKRILTSLGNNLVNNYSQDGQD